MSTHTSTTSFSLLNLEFDGSAAVITLNRPQKFNALNGEMRREISTALSQLNANEQIRGIVITGGPRVFIAGADVKEFLDRRPLDSFSRMAKTPDIWQQVATMKVPVVAAIAGLAVGGGLELAMACDLRVAAENAQFGQTEINLGLIPGRGGTQRLPRLIGMTRAKEMVLTGRLIHATEALEWGLVNRVVPVADMMTEAKKLVASFAAKSSLAVQMAKLMLNHGQDVNLDTALTMESLAFSNMFSTDDMREGIDAFLHKRRANYPGT